MNRVIMKNELNLRENKQTNKTTWKYHSICALERPTGKIV